MEKKYSTNLEKYFIETKNAAYTALFVIPLFFTYETMALILTVFQGSQFRNGADILVKNLISFAGLDRFPFVILIILIGLAVIAGYYKNKHNIEIKGEFFLFLIIESAVLAFVFEALTSNTAGLIIFVTKQYLLASGDVGPTLYEKLMLSIGAGIYEELVFRLICMGLIIHFLNSIFDNKDKRIFNWKTFTALIISSLIFSAFHYINGYGGHNFDLDSFIFRAVGGVYLSFIFLIRGFGVSAWTHVFYDVFSVLGLF